MKHSLFLFAFPKCRLVTRAICIAATAMLGGCGPSWGWYVVDPTDRRGLGNLEFLLGGLAYTAALSAAVMAASITLGLPIALASFSRFRAVRVLNLIYVEVFRAIPVLVLVLWVFYGLPIVSGLRLDVFTTVFLALALCDAAFCAEIFRAGVQSIPAGQTEAAKALGLPALIRLWRVTLPQALRNVLPPLGNQFVQVLKMSSLASVVGYPELTRRANELIVTVFRPLEIYTALVLEYLVLVLSVSMLVRRMEHGLRGGTSR